MTATTTKLGADMQDAQIEAVANSLRQAWQLGQTYWQQADSESWKQQDKSNETRLKFEALMDETRRLLARQPAAIGKEAAVGDLVGTVHVQATFRNGTHEVTEPIVNLARAFEAKLDAMPGVIVPIYAAPLDNEASKPAVVQGCDIDFSGVMGIPPKHDALDVCPKCSCRRGSGSQCSNKPCPFDRASPAAPSVEQDERVAFRDTLRAALKSYRRANPSRYLNDDQVDASDSEFVSDLMAYVPVGEKPRAASTSANVAQNEHPAFRDIASALLHIDVRGVSIGDKAIIQAAIDALNSANVAQGAETVGYYLEYGSGRYDVIPAWATADKNQALLVKQRGSPVYRVAPPAQTALTDQLQAEVERLNSIINTPHADDFLRAASIEAEHQRQRWGTEGDAGKTPADWFWLVRYLGGKALHAHAANNTEKAEHHIITTAAVLANWHRNMFGKTDMRPGIDGDAALTAAQSASGGAQ